MWIERLVFFVDERVVVWDEEWGGYNCECVKGENVDVNFLCCYFYGFCISKGVIFGGCCSDDVYFDEGE